MFIKCLLLLLAASFLTAGLVPAPENRIIGGVDIQIENAPWQVLITAKKFFQCGGSIYSRDIIITAAHCLYDPKKNLLEAKDFQVIVGSEFKRSRDTLVKVAAIKHHEGYSPETKIPRNDIGIMKLSEPLNLTTTVQLIPLATKNPAPQSIAWSTGWGKAMFYDVFYRPFEAQPEVLQGIEISINDLSWCKAQLPWMAEAEGTICAGSGRGSTCVGDSGGPLVVNNELVGVVSAGSERCDSAGVYTSVAYFHKWILNSIKSI